MFVFLSDGWWSTSEFIYSAIIFLHQFSIGSFWLRTFLHSVYYFSLCKPCFWCFCFVGEIHFSFTDNIRYSLTLTAWIFFDWSWCGHWLNVAKQRAVSINAIYVSLNASMDIFWGDGGVFFFWVWTHTHKRSITISMALQWEI